MRDPLTTHGPERRGQIPQLQQPCRRWAPWLVDPLYAQLAQYPRINRICLGLNVKARKVVLGGIGQDNMHRLADLVKMVGKVLIIDPSGLHQKDNLRTMGSNSLCPSQELVEPFVPITEIHGL